MFTVLPTPAPPNRPILPPLANGQIRSMTLMPVSSSSTDGDSSSNFGAFWWIARRSSVAIGPASSIGRPSTSMMRPSVAVPTGTEIAAPVLLTVMPRRRPSDEPIAMVRTTPSPSCCCTSKVRPFSASDAAGVREHQRVVNAGHRLARELDVDHRADALNDCPLTHGSCLPVPCIRFLASRTGPRCRVGGPDDRLDRSRAADDLGQFLGDRRLARLVVRQLQLVDHLLARCRTPPSSRPSARSARTPCSRPPPGTPAPRRNASAARRARLCASGS